MLDDEALMADVALAQMIARFEPAIARALLEPAAQRVPQLASPAESTLKAMSVVVAAVYVDPNWAVELLDRLPEPTGASLHESKNHARVLVARVLGLERRDRWEEVGYWEPRE
jgi:hypothetical protein